MNNKTIQNTEPSASASAPTKDAAPAATPQAPSPDATAQGFTLAHVHPGASGKVKMTFSGTRIDGVGTFVKAPPGSQDVDVHLENSPVTNVGKFIDTTPEEKKPK